MALSAVLCLPDCRFGRLRIRLRARAVAVRCSYPARRIQRTLAIYRSHAHCGVEWNAAIDTLLNNLMGCAQAPIPFERSEEHTSELQSLMRISYAVFCFQKKTKYNNDKLL